MRTQALFGIITVLLRAATLVFQSLVIGGIVFQRWIAAPETPEDDRRRGAVVIRISAIALAATQALYLGLNTKILVDSLGAGLSEIAGANFFIAGVVTIAGNTRHRAAAPKSARPRESNHLKSLKLVPFPTPQVEQR